MRVKPITLNGADYLVDDKGNVYGKTGKIKQRPNDDGYASFTGGCDKRRRRYCTHRIVAELFVPNPYGLPEVDHKDANRMNPAADNLEWVTHYENVQRAVRKGNTKGKIRGTKNPKAKLNEDDVRRIRQQYAGGLSIREIHRQSGIAKSTIGNIVHRHTWKHVE